MTLAPQRPCRSKRWPAGRDMWRLATPFQRHLHVSRAAVCDATCQEQGQLFLEITSQLLLLLLCLLTFDKKKSKARSLLALHANSPFKLRIVVRLEYSDRVTRSWRRHLPFGQIQLPEDTTSHPDTPDSAKTSGQPLEARHQQTWVRACHGCPASFGQRRR